MGTLTSGGAVFADGSYAIIGQSIIGTTSNAQYTLEVGAVAVLAHLTVATIESGSSCMDHSPGSGEWCLELDSSPVEPRFPGVTKLELTLSSTVSSIGASVSCDVGGEPAVSSVTPSGATVTIIFADPLPDQSCCTITLNGDSTDSFDVISLAGDVSREGNVTVSDKSLIKPKIGDPVDATNFLFDVSGEGNISLSDKNLIKPKIGHSASCQP
ncbi:MAG: hypothetical protein ACYSVY_08425 [Planctomycetota bacterium]